MVPPRHRRTAQYDGNAFGSLRIDDVANSGNANATKSNDIDSAGMKGSELLPSCPILPGFSLGDNLSHEPETFRKKISVLTRCKPE